MICQTCKWLPLVASLHSALLSARYTRSLHSAVPCDFRSRLSLINCLRTFLSHPPLGKDPVYTVQQWQNITLCHTVSAAFHKHIQFIASPVQTRKSWKLMNCFLCHVSFILLPWLFSSLFQLRLQLFWINQAVEEYFKGDLREWHQSGQLVCLVWGLLLYLNLTLYRTFLTVTKSIPVKTERIISTNRPHWSN